MNKELFIKAINDDLEKMRQQSRRFFTEEDLYHALAVIYMLSKSKIQLGK